jgi:hypothetical protein
VFIFFTATLFLVAESLVAYRIISRRSLRLKSFASGPVRSVDCYPDKLFIVVTPPPLNPAETNLETAARARIMADWLTSEEFLADYPFKLREQWDRVNFLH